MTRIITRRDFVRSAAVAGATASLSSLIGCRRPDNAGGALRTMDGVSEASLRDFRAAFRGSLIQPEDAVYEQARRVFNARFDRHPGLMARPADANDVATAVQFARAEKLVTAVRGGGHSYAGHSTCDGGLVIDLSQMKGLQIEPAGALVRTQSGFVTADLDRAAHRAGLVVVLAETPSVGISGLILGGGFCQLTAALGMASDNLIAAQVVLADGRIVTASAEENPDLFWALRGGGGNFGIVTDFTIQAHRVPQVVEGMLMFDLAQAPAVLRGWRELTSSMPDPLHTCALLMPADGPARSRLGIRVCDTRPPEAVEPWLRSLRALGKPIADTIAPKTYLDAQASSPAPPAGMSNSMRHGFFPALSDDLIEALPALMADRPTTCLVSLLHWHGASCRIPVEATAFPHREPGYSLMVTSLWGNPAQNDANVEWVERVSRTVAPLTRGVYVNLLEDEGPGRIRAAYGDNYGRLVTIKQKYDPDNVFRLNQNIGAA